MKLQTQVIIVGAGPTGLSMAAQLVRYGIDFVILERNEKTTPLSKAIVVQARTLETFEELGIAEKALSEGQVTTGLNLFYQGKQRAHINLSGLGDGLSPFPYALSLEQSKTEKLLVDFLASNNKKVLWQCEFTHFIEHDNKVVAYYKDSEGQEHGVEGEFLVGCDGASSPVRHQMNLSFEGDTVPKIFYVADVKITSAIVKTNEVFMFMIDKGFIVFFPMEGEGHYRIVGILPGASDANEAVNFAAVESTIKQEISVPVHFTEVNWFSTYKVHSRKAASFEKGRCFIAGDAAHIHTPAGGQGMNTGIQDAYNLAWKIAYKVRGQVSPAVLKTYSSEREENAKHLLQTTDRMFDLMAGRTQLFNFIRLHFFAPLVSFITNSKAVKKRIFPLISQIGISYENSFLTIKSSIGKVKAGVRITYFTFSDGSNIFDHIADPAFKILFFGSDEENKSDKITQTKLTIVAKAFKEIPSKLFGNEKNFYILLRPDNHISYIGKDVKTCQQLLDKISATIS